LTESNGLPLFLGTDKRIDALPAVEVWGEESPQIRSIERLALSGQPLAACGLSLLLKDRPAASVPTEPPVTRITARRIDIPDSHATCAEGSLESELSKQENFHS